MPRVLPRFTPDLVRALPAAGRFSDPRNGGRRAAILEVGCWGRETAGERSAWPSVSGHFARGSVALRPQIDVDRMAVVAPPATRRQESRCDDETDGSQMEARLGARKWVHETSFGEHAPYRSARRVPQEDIGAARGRPASDEGGSWTRNERHRCCSATDHERQSCSSGYEPPTRRRQRRLEQAPRRRGARGPRRLRARLRKLRQGHDRRTASPVRRTNQAEPIRDACARERDGTRRGRDSLVAHPPGRRDRNGDGRRGRVRPVTRHVARRARMRLEVACVGLASCRSRMANRPTDRAATSQSPNRMCCGRLLAHELERAHGDLRPWTPRVGDRRVSRQGREEIVAKQAPEVAARPHRDANRPRRALCRRDQRLPGHGAVPRPPQLRPHVALRRVRLGDLVFPRPCAREGPPHPRPRSEHRVAHHHR